MLKFQPFGLFSDVNPLACDNLINLVPNLHNLWRYLLYQLSFNTTLQSQILIQSVSKHVTL